MARAALGPVLLRLLRSEAMAAFCLPATRALPLQPPRTVLRDRPFCRSGVSRAWLRVTCCVEPSNFFAARE